MLPNVEFPRHHPRVWLSGLACCGVLELVSLMSRWAAENPVEFLALIGQEKQDRQFGGLIWTQIVEYAGPDKGGYGKNWDGTEKGPVREETRVDLKLKAIIEENDFGSVTLTPAATNMYSSRNKIVVGVWTMTEEQSDRFDEWVSGNTYPVAVPQRFLRAGAF